MPESAGPLHEGVERFRSEHYPRLRERFRRLAEEGQAPHTLFVGCSDSRVLPDVLADAGPGELFVVRNVGGLVPAPGGDASVGAAVEYAVRVLGVSDAVVCGHSRCGAVAALFDPPAADAPDLERWLEGARPAAERAVEALRSGSGSPGPAAGDDLPDDPGRELLREAERQSVRLQLERLADLPPVREATAAGDLTLHGWHYRIGPGEVDALDPRSGEFRPAAVSGSAGG